MSGRLHCCHEARIEPNDLGGALLVQVDPKMEAPLCERLDLLFLTETSNSVHGYSERLLFEDSAFVNLPACKNLFVTPKSIRMLFSQLFTDVELQKFESVDESVPSQG